MRLREVNHLTSCLPCFCVYLWVILKNSVFNACEVQSGRAIVFSLVDAKQAIWCNASCSGVMGCKAGWAGVTCWASKIMIKCRAWQLLRFN